MHMHIHLHKHKHKHLYTYIIIQYNYISPYKPTNFRHEFVIPSWLHESRKHHHQPRPAHPEVLWARRFGLRTFLPTLREFGENSGFSFNVTSQSETIYHFFLFFFAGGVSRALVFQDFVYWFLRVDGKNDWSEDYGCRWLQMIADGCIWPVVSYGFQWVWANKYSLKQWNPQLATGLSVKKNIRGKKKKVPWFSWNYSLEN